MRIYNRSGNLAYEVELADVIGIAARHDAHIDGDRIVDDETGRTLFSIEHGASDLSAEPDQG